MTNRELEELKKRVDEHERAFEDVCNALMVIKEHLPKVVLWQPGVKEALEAARITCERVAARRQSNSHPPSDPRLHKAKKL